MSINMGNDLDGSELTYSDHEIQHIRHQLSFNGGEPSSPPIEDERQFEITARGLDPDEIAELRGMRVQVSTFFDADTAEDNVGSVRIDADAGFNLSGTEVLSLGASTEDKDPDDDGTDEGEARFRTTDEVGQLWTWSGVVSAPFDDDTNGNGGGAYAVNQTEMLVFPDFLGTGPVVDVNDDFTSKLRCLETANESELGVEVRYSLYYLVDEIEDSRPRYGY